MFLGMDWVELGKRGGRIVEISSSSLGFFLGGV